jgi:Raf kinase inhibitor-like YbhB/YbcL family protein
MNRSIGPLLVIGATALVAACSSANIGRDASGGGSGGGAGGTGGAVTEGGIAERTGDGGALTLTSPAFAEGEAIPTANTCAGADTSPELDWTSGPGTAMSYALVFTDVNDDVTLWAVWDIPADANSLPAMVPSVAALATPAGAKQVRLGGNGYNGPCPGGVLHQFRFELQALDVATLSRVSTTSTPAEVRAESSMHTIANARLTGSSDAD